MLTSKPSNPHVSAGSWRWKHERPSQIGSRDFPKSHPLVVARLQGVGGRSCPRSGVHSRRLARVCLGHRQLARATPQSSQALETPEEIARAGRIYAGNREHVPPVVALLFATQVLNFGLQAVLPIGHPDSCQRAGFAIAAMSAAYLAAVTWLVTRMVPRPRRHGRQRLDRVLPE